MSSPKGQGWVALTPDPALSFLRSLEGCYGSGPAGARGREAHGGVGERAPRGGELPSPS